MVLASCHRKSHKLIILLEAVDSLDNEAITWLPNRHFQRQKLTLVSSLCAGGPTVHNGRTMYARRTARAVRQMVVNHGWAALMRTARARLRQRLRRRSSQPSDTTTWLPT